jgi:N-acyl-L-homoserine lactone synthetase
VIESKKAKRAFPKLLPQHEFDCEEPSSIRRPFFAFGSEPKTTPESEPEIVTALEPEPPADSLIEIEATTLSVRNFHEYGDLYSRYLRGRRDVFIVEKGWQLPETDGMEFDQYDTPLARWIVLQGNGVVLGGARISPTTAQCGNHSYMLRDAQLGLLPGLPADMLDETAPVDKEIWEATRLFLTEAVPTDQRMQVQSSLMLEMAAAARSVGATHIIGIVPAVFKRWLKRIGMTATEMGPVKIIDGDRVQAALMNVVDGVA